MAPMTTSAVFGRVVLAIYVLAVAAAVAALLASG